MYLRESTNEYDTQVSVFLCDACGTEYTVCPAITPEQRDAESKDGCMWFECSTYDPARDVDKLFEQGDPSIGCVAIQ